MECLMVFLFLMVIFLIATGSAARAQSKSLRRRRTWQQVAKRFAGVYVSGGLFGQARISFRYGDSRALFRETQSRGAYSGRCSEVQIEWHDSRQRIEFYRFGTPVASAPIGRQGDIGTDAEDFLENYLIEHGQYSELESILSEGVRWQINQLRLIDSGESGIYFAIRRGRLIVRKAIRLSSYEAMEEFIRDSLALFDQAMLTQARGIEFVEPALSMPLSDVICKICGDEIEEEMVFCRRCKTPHHLECWHYNGACSVYGCQETRYLEPRSATTMHSHNHDNHKPPAQPDAHEA